MNAPARSVLQPQRVIAYLELLTREGLIDASDSAHLRTLAESLNSDWRILLSEAERLLFPKKAAAQASASFTALRSRFEQTVSSAVAGGRLKPEQRIWLDVSAKHSQNPQCVRFLGAAQLMASARLSDLEAAEDAGQLYDNIAVRPRGGEPILILTVNDIEYQAVLDVFSVTGQVQKFSRESYPYVYLGEARGDNDYSRSIVLFRCQMGSVRSGAASSRVPRAIEHLRPHAVLAVGIAFGDRTRQQLGDVLIAEQVVNYESERLNADGTHQFRSERLPSSPNWLERVTVCEVPDVASCRGLLLCGEKLIDNQSFRDVLAKEFHRSIGGDMESFGMATACQELNVHWAVIKGVSDWADGTKNEGGDASKDALQRNAALNAARVAYAAIFLQPPVDFDPSNRAGKTSQRFGHKSKAAPKLTDHDQLPGGVDLETWALAQSQRDTPQFGSKQTSSEAESAAADSLQKTLLEWLEQADAPPLFAILGEYGMGKTISCQRLTKHLEHVRQSNDAPAWLRQPIYFDLRNLSLLKGVSRQDSATLPTAEAIVDDLFNRGWVAGPGVALPRHSDLQEWMAAGALLILDGLDECLVHLDESQHGLFLQTLLRLLTDHLPQQSRVSSDLRIVMPRLLVSCRTNFFKTLSDQRSIFTGYQRDRVDADWYQCRVLLPLKESQIREYLSQVLPDLPTDQVLALIDDIHNLRELAERPMTLKLLGEYIPDLERLRQKGETVNGATLYGLVANKWLQRDAGKHHLQPEHKLRLMPALAAHLWRSGVRSLPYEELHTWFHAWRDTQPDLAKRYGPESYNQIKLEEDLRTASFVVREDGEGDHEEGFRFAHSSMQEYFLACYLAQAVREDRFEDWAMPIPSAETLDFLAQRLELDQAALKSAQKARGGLTEILNRWRKQYQPEASELLLRYALRKTKDTSGAVVRPLLAGFDLRGAKLRGWRFGERLPKQASQPLPMNTVCWVGADLREAQFAHANLSDGDFSDANLDRASLQHCDLRQCQGQESSRMGTVFRHCRLEQEAWLPSAKSYRSQIVACEAAAAAKASDESFFGAALMPSEISPPGFLGAARRLSPAGSNSVPQTTAPISALRLTDGSRSPVECVAILPDGRRALSGTWDHTLRLWDLHSGECLLTLSGHTHWVTNVAILPDGRRALSGSDDNTLRLWDLASGESAHTLAGHTAFVTSVAVLIDGCRALSGSVDNTLRLWDLTSGECLLTLAGHTGSVTSVAILPDGRRALSGSVDNTLRLWDLTSGECLLNLSRHIESVTSVAILPDGRRALSGSVDDTLRLWDLTSGECLLTLSGHTDSVSSVAIFPDGRRALSGAADGSLRVWDLTTGECLQTLSRHNRSVTSVAILLDGRRALSGAEDGTLRVWDLTTGECLQTFSGHARSANSVAVLPDGRSALSGSSDNVLRLWDLTSGECLQTLSGHTDSVSSVAIFPDGRRALSGADDDTLRLWDLTSGECVQTLSGLDEWVTSVAILPDGRRALSGARWGSALRLWDLTSGECLQTLSEHTGTVTCVAVLPDGRRAISSSADNTLRLWDLSSGECLQTLSGHTSWVDSVATLPDGRRALSGSNDHTLRLWELASGECLQILSGHTNGVTSVAVLTDGRRALSGSADNTLRLWDLQTGECLQTLAGHTGSVTSVAILANGKQALSSSDDGTLRLWNLDAPADQACQWIAAIGSPYGIPSHASWRPAHALSEAERAEGNYDRLLDASGDAWRFVSWMVKGHPPNPDGWTKLPLQGYEPLTKP